MSMNNENFQQESPHYPHASGHSGMRPVRCFRFGARTLSLYWLEGRTKSAPYSLYWDDERNPVQHAMTDQEVFTQLSIFCEQFCGSDEDRTVYVKGSNGLTAEDLIAALQKVPPKTRIMFDTEAARFNVHLVPVNVCEYDSCSFADAVVLHTDSPRDR